MRRVVLFGDSIVNGQDEAVHRRWSHRLSAKIEDWAGDEIVTISAAVNGNTSRLALERMPMDVQQAGVDILYIQFGLNDCNYWATDRGLPRVGKESFEANIKEIVVRGQLFGAQHVLLATNHPTLRCQPAFLGADFTYEDSRRAYNDVIRRVAAENPAVTLIDIDALLTARISRGEISVEELVLSDGLHLSNLGHQLYFDAIEPVMKAAAQIFNAS